MDAPEGTEICSERGPSAFAGVAVDLAEPVSIRVARPFVHAVANGGMGGMTAGIALPLVGREERATSRHVFGDEIVAGPPSGMITDPEALLPCRPRHDTDDRWAIIGLGPMALALISPPPWRVGGVTMGRAFVPRRSDTVHPPQRPCQPSSR
jgi:hypothetical protein